MNKITALCDKIIEEKSFENFNDNYQDVLAPMYAAKLSRALKVAIDALESIKKLGAYHITYDPPAKPGTSLFNIQDRQINALEEIEEIFNNTKDCKDKK